MIDITHNFTADRSAADGAAGVALTFMLSQAYSAVQQMRTWKDNTITSSYKTNLAQQRIFGFLQLTFQLSNLFSRF